APYDVHIVVLAGMDAHGDEAAAALDEAGFAVLLDDRDARAGEKFADADLIGCPFRVTVGRKAAEDGTVDLRERAKGEDDAVKVLRDLGVPCGRHGAWRSLVSALVWGTRGPEFESRRPDRTHHHQPGFRRLAWCVQLRCTLLVENVGAARRTWARRELTAAA